MPYRRCGRSGIKLPAISLGLWNRFGDDTPIAEPARDHPPRVRSRHHPHRPGQQLRPALRLRGDATSAGSMREDLRPYRDELIISTKAGYDMWPGPYGEWGSRKYLTREPRPEPEPHGARVRRHLLLAPLRPGHAAGGDDRRARHRGAPGQGARTSASAPTRAERTKDAVEIARALGTPILIHQPSYSLLNRWIEPEVVDTCGEEGVGIIAFSPLGQGMLTDRYLGGIPADSRAAKDFYLKKDFINEDNMARVKALNEIAAAPRAEARVDGARVGAARPARDQRADRRVERASSSRPTSPRSTTSRSPTRSWPRSTSTRSTPASTSGPSRAVPSRREMIEQFIPRSPLVAHLGLRAGVDRDRRGDPRPPVPARAGDDGRHRPRRRDREPDRHRRHGRVVGRRRRAGVAGRLDCHAERQLPQPPRAGRT